MAGHLSKNKDFDLYVYNRTDEVADKWLNQHDGSKFILNNSPNLKFHGLIICLKDDHSIVDLLVNKKLLSYLNKNSFIIDLAKQNNFLLYYLQIHLELNLLKYLIIFYLINNVFPIFQELTNDQFHFL